MSRRRRATLTIAPGQRSARAQRERRLQRAVWALIGAFLFLILAIPAYGYYDTFVSPLRQPVTQVNDRVFDMAHYIKRLRFIDSQSKLTQQQADWATIPFQLIDDLENGELLRQGAAPP